MAVLRCRALLVELVLDGGRAARSRARQHVCSGTHVLP